MIDGDALDLGEEGEVGVCDAPDRVGRELEPDGPIAQDDVGMVVSPFGEIDDVGNEGKRPPRRREVPGADQHVAESIPPLGGRQTTRDLNLSQLGHGADPLDRGWQASLGASLVPGLDGDVNRPQPIISRRDGPHKGNPRVLSASWNRVRPMIALLCLAIVVASLLGGTLPLSTVLTHTRLQLYLSFAAGAMLGAAFFHMLPEAVNLGSPGTLRWTAAGLLSLFFLERFFAFHHHEAPADPAEPCPPHAHEHEHGRGHSAGLINPSAPGGGTSAAKGSTLHWGAAAFGLAVHSLVGGVALASAVTADLAIGKGLGPAAWGVFIATIVHKPADALTIVSLMLRAGVPKVTAHLVNLGFSLMIPAGALLFVVSIHGLGAGFSNTFTANSLAFSAGTFLCIALSDLLPELQFHEHDRVKLSASLLAGVLLMAVAGGLESKEHKDIGGKSLQRSAKPAQSAE
jgi:zinc and cadmium transporter